MREATLFGEEEPDLEAFFGRLETIRKKRALTHTLHPYPAKFIPQIPRVLVEALAPRGLPVLDPMCGSGTVLVEAASLGFDAVGVDLNPIAVLASRAKTTVLQADGRQALRVFAGKLRRLAADLGAGNSEATADVVSPTFRNIDRWFEPAVVPELALLRQLCSELDEPLKTVANACFSAVLVGVSNQESETSWRRKVRSIAPGDASDRLADKLDASVAMLADYAHLNPGRVQVHEADARRLPVGDASVGMVLTSPPYANSHDYYLYHKLRLFWLGHDVHAVQDEEIGSRHKHSDRKEGIETYRDAMLAVLSEMHRVLGARCPAAVVVADAVIRGQLHDMKAFYESIGAEVGLTLERSFSYEHRRFNSTFQRGFGTSHAKRTHVLVFRKG